MFCFVLGGIFQLATKKKQYKSYKKIFWAKKKAQSYTIFWGEKIEITKFGP
jgi:hypothetical protein